MCKRNARFSKNHKIALSPDLEGVVGATAAWVYQKWVAYVPESVFRLFGDDLNPIFQQNHHIFGCHHCHKSTRSLTNCIDFPKIGGRVGRKMNDIEVCNGRIDFKFSLKQCSYILVCVKNTFGAIPDLQKSAHNF